MADLNAVALTGRLCGDPELKHLPSGTAVAEFRIAVSGWNGKAEEETTSFLSCVAFGKTAEFTSKHFVKGDGVALVGQLEQQRWEDKAGGGNRERVVIKVDRASFPPGKSGNRASGDAAARPGATSEPEPAFPSSSDNDDPFGDQ